MTAATPSETRAELQKHAAALEHVRGWLFARKPGKHIPWQVKSVATDLAALAIIDGNLEALDAVLDSGLITSQSKSGRWLLPMFAAHEKQAACFDRLIDRNLIPKGASHDIARTLYEKLGLEALRKAVKAGLNPYAYRYDGSVIALITDRPLAEQEKFFRMLHERILEFKKSKLENAIRNHNERVRYGYTPETRETFLPLAFWDPVAKRYMLDTCIFRFGGGFGEAKRTELMVSAISEGAFGDPKTVAQDLVKTMAGREPPASASKQDLATYTALVLQLSRIGQSAPKVAPAMAMGL